MINKPSEYITSFIQFLHTIKSIVKFKSHDTETESGRSNERYRRIIITGASSAGVKIFTASIGLLTVPLTIDFLGTELYGLWMTITSVMVMMTFADLGLGNGLINAVSKANGKKNIKDAQEAVSSTFYLLLAISVFLLVIFLYSFPIINWGQLLNVKSEIAIKESGSTIFVVVIAFLINLPLGIIRRIQEGYQEGFIFQLWQIAGALCSFIGLLICIYLETSLTWLAISYTGGQMIATIFNGIYMFSRQRKELLPRFDYFKFETGRKLIRTGIIFFFMGIFTIIANSSDNLIIARTLGVESVPKYEIVKRIFLFSMFTQFLIVPLWPAFGEAMAKKDYGWAKKTINRALKLTLISGAIISFPLFAFGKQIISLWVGSEFEPSWFLLTGFFFHVVLSNYVGVMSTFLNSGEWMSKQFPMLGAVALSSVLLKYYLVISIGVSGIIWGTVLAWGIFFMIPSYYLYRSILK